MFPKWLQKLYPNLKNEKTTMSVLRIEILEKTDLKNEYTEFLDNRSYSRAKIACCKKCNNEFLNKIEGEVINQLDNTTQKTPYEEDIIKAWLLKIFLSRYIYDKKTGNKFGNDIEEKDFRMELEYIRINLYNYIYKKNSSFLRKCTLFIFNVNTSDFDYRDSITEKYIFIQFNYNAFILSINDYNLSLKSEYLSDIIKTISKEKLHNFQCYEILSIILSYRETIELNIVAKDGNLEYISVIHKESNKLKYVSKYMVTFWNDNYSEIYKKKLIEADFIFDENSYKTFLRKCSGEFIHIDSNILPLP